MNVTNIEKDLNTLLAKNHPQETVREHTDKVKNSALILKNLNYISEEQYNLLNLTCEYHDYGKLNIKFQERIKNNKKFDSNNEMGHNILSTYFISENKFKNKEDYKTVFFAVLNHHHYTNNLFELRNKNEDGAYFLKQYEVEEIDEIFLEEFDNDFNSKFSVLTGLLNKCDYSGSGGYTVEYKNDFLLDSLENLNYKWRDLQKYLIENRDENLIVVASTGLGKTEAGLLWIGDNKGFFILPLKTAINSIFNRIKNDIIKTDTDTKVVLLHSEASDFLLENYIEEMSYQKIQDYTNRGKNFSIPLTISTLDQIFNFVFLYKGFEVKLATLSYSKVVIDEIQAYSPDLLAYIIVGLKKLKEAGGKFAILTATLPPFIKYYLEKYLGEIKYKKFFTKNIRHSLKVVNEKINSTFIYSHYLEKKGKVLVICNTVKMAQNLYDELIELGVSKKELELFHAKFIKKDRLKKEIDILNFGKTNNLGNKIWVSTSIVEASLDIDFDFIFTELSDLSGLFQRLGRINRKGEKEVKTYNAYVFTSINPRLFINKETGFIDREIFNLSKKALEEVDGFISEEDKYELIEKYLTIDNLKDSDFNKNFNNNKNYIESALVYQLEKTEVVRRFRNILSYKIIPNSVYIENQETIDSAYKIYINEFGEKKEKAKNEINSFTLSVGIYEKGKAKKNIELNKEKIWIVDGDYSYETGFKSFKNLYDNKEEEKFDNFM